MSGRKVSVDQLAAAITQELEAYSQEKTDELKKTIKKTAETCKREIQAASPVLTGSYRKGWAVKVEYESASDIRVAVHNRTDYQLTHLLEYGHAGRGGTNIGSAPAHPHIKKAEENAAEALGKDVKIIFSGA